MPKYPEPPVKYTGYSDLHFGTEQQVRSRLALGNYDRGELSLSPRRLTFRGMRVLVDCPNVAAVQLVRKSFPWGIVAALGLVAGVIVYLTSPVPFTWRQPLPYILLAILLIVCVRQARERWVEVVYAGEKGPRRAYFRRAPVFGGSGAPRTRELCREITKLVLGGKGEGAV